MKCCWKDLDLTILQFTNISFKSSCSFDVDFSMKCNKDVPVLRHTISHQCGLWSFICCKIFFWTWCYEIKTISVLVSFSEENPSVAGGFPPQEVTLWRHNKETPSALLTLCEGKPPVTGGFPHKGPVTKGFYISFGVSLNKLFKKQTTRHCNELCVPSSINPL